MSLAFLALSCGTGSDYAGGGTGGTGISTGSITAFGSVVVNGVHFKTDGDVAPGFRTNKLVNGWEDRSGRQDKGVFAAGMIVTVRHGTADNNASEIEYRDNLRGPIARIITGADNTIEVLGQTVVVDNNTIFDGTAFASLQRDDVVEVSGFADNAGRIRAAYILRMAPPMPPPFREFEVKGFVSGLSGATFRLGPLPDGQGAPVLVSYSPAAVSGLPGRPADGMFVQVVTTDWGPVPGFLTANRVVKLAARTEFLDGTPVVLEGLITRSWSGPGAERSFAVEGKTVLWDVGTKFDGGLEGRLQEPNTKVQVQGTENGGILSAARIVFPQ
jgi:hypothetical protein